jgi:hypothetical protein
MHLEAIKLGKKLVFHEDDSGDDEPKAGDQRGDHMSDSEMAAPTPTPKKAPAKPTPTPKKVATKRAPTPKKVAAKRAPTPKKVAAKRAPTPKKRVVWHPMMSAAVPPIPIAVAIPVEACWVPDDPTQARTQALNHVRPQARSEFRPDDS